MAPSKTVETFPIDGERRRGCCSRQLIGSFAAIWDAVLPPTPEDVWQANVAVVVAALDDR